MNKLWKSLIIIFACVAMVFSSSSPAFAKDVTTTYTYNGVVNTPNPNFAQPTQPDIAQLVPYMSLGEDGFFVLNIKSILLP